MRRAAALMMASVFLSRILGYARDAVIAYQHGATPETDAYFTAFTIPDFLNYLLAGGALSRGGRRTGIGRSPPLPPSWESR
jgi:putative peptidoglycan lipid II flippase